MSWKVFFRPSTPSYTRKITEKYSLTSVFYKVLENIIVNSKIKNKFIKQPVFCFHTKHVGTYFSYL